MDKSIIGVRVANGTFEPILDTSGKTRRRLVLTTVRDDQTSVQIDLYRGADESMENAEYVGSLMIENITAAPRGEADVTMLLGIDESGNLNATATDKASGEHQSLSVGLESVEPGDGYNMPDFELSDEELTLEDLSLDDDELALDESAASLALDDVTLEEDFSLDIDTDSGTDSLAIPVDESAPVAEDGLEESLDGLELPDELDLGGDIEEETITEESFEIEESIEEPAETDGLAGLEDFSEESISIDDSFADEFTMEDETLEPVDPAEAEAGFATDELTELDDGMVEADLGDEDFTFAEPDENLFEDASAGASESEDELESDFGGAPEFGESDDLGAEEFPPFGAEPEGAAVPGAFGANAVPLAPRKSNGIVYVGYIVLALAALGVLTYLVFRLLEGPPAPPLQASLPLMLLAVPARPRKRRGLFRRRR